MEGDPLSNLTKAEFRNPGADRHCYIATPAHTIFANFHVSLIRTIPVLLEAGISVTYAHLAGHCHVDDARNLLVADFLKSSATDLLFWDADVAAEPAAALRLLQHGGDIVGGAYPLKDGSGRFPVKFDQTGKILTGLPTGFLCVKREVLAALSAQNENVELDGVTASMIFERGVRFGQRIGGDLHFSRKAVEAGFKMHLVRDILFTHAGVVDFAGRLSDHLNESHKGPPPSPVPIGTHKGPVPKPVPLQETDGDDAS